MLLKISTDRINTERDTRDDLPPTVGGASNVSLMRSRKSSSTSQVSLTMETDSRASFWTAVRTCWQSLMWFKLCCSGLEGVFEKRERKTITHKPSETIPHLQSRISGIFLHGWIGAGITLHNNLNQQMPCLKKSQEIHANSCEFHDSICRLS